VHDGGGYPPPARSCDQKTGQKIQPLDASCPHFDRRAMPDAQNASLGFALRTYRDPKVGSNSVDGVVLRAGEYARTRTRLARA